MSIRQIAISRTCFKIISFIRQFNVSTLFNNHKESLGTAQISNMLSKERGSRRKGFSTVERGFRGWLYAGGL